MGTLIESDMNRWAVKRKIALVQDIVQGKTTIPEAWGTFMLRIGLVVSE